MEQKQISVANYPWLVECCTQDKDEMVSLTSLVDIPFHILEIIMERCVGVEYMNFRATCKLCYLAAPLIHWSHGKRLHNYSLVSPWLMEFDMCKGIITFTDPVSGHNYFIKNKLQESIYECRICCSRYGWVLLFTNRISLVFYNPFTSDIRKIPITPPRSLENNLSFSAPPTCPDCVVVGFTTKRDIFMYFVNDENSLAWRVCRVKTRDPFSYRSPTFCGRDLFFFCKEISGIDVFNGWDGDNWENIISEPLKICCTSSPQYLLAVCGQHTLLVVVGEFGESIELFQPKEDGDQCEWEEIHCLGNHMIYVSDSTCICIEAKIPEMRNKIYFPRLYRNKMVFYSLQTRRYHTFNGKENFGDFLETKHYVNPHTWIEPSWC